MLELTDEEVLVEELSKLIILLAKRDVYNGVGRVFISELSDQGYTREQVSLAIQKLRKSFRISVVGEMIKVNFSGETNA